MALVATQQRLGIAAVLAAAVFFQAGLVDLPRLDRVTQAALVVLQTSLAVAVAEQAVLVWLALALMPVLVALVHHHQLLERL